MKENKHKLILINFNVLWILFALLRQMDLTKMSTGLWIAISVNAISSYHAFCVHSQGESFPGLVKGKRSQRVEIIQVNV